MVEVLCKTHKNSFGLKHKGFVKSNWAYFLEIYILALKVICWGILRTNESKALISA